MGWISAGGAILGGLLGASGSKSAARTQANAQLEAARLQAEAAKLKNAYMSGGFGTGQLTVDSSGAPTASYTLAPQLQQMRDLLYGQSFAGMPSSDTTGFYNQMQQQAQQRALDAMGMSPTDAAAKEYGTIQGLLSPQRAREQASLAQNLFKSGRMGAGTSYGAGSGYINPQQYSYMKALEEQNTQLGLTALDRARQQQTSDIQNYYNLAGQAPASLANLYSTQASLFGKGADIERLGMAPLDYISGLQGRATQASASAGNALAQGMANASSFQAAGQQAYPQAISSMFNTLGQRPVSGIDPTTGQFTYGPSPLQKLGSSISSWWNSPSTAPSWWNPTTPAPSTAFAPIDQTGWDAGYHN